MNTTFSQNPPFNHLPGTAKQDAQRASDAFKEAAHRTSDAVKQAAQRATDATKHVAQRTPDTAKDFLQTVSAKVEDTMVQTNEFIRQNPVGMAVGALALGAVCGFTFVMTRRDAPTFRERFIGEPLDAARKAIFAALAPLSPLAHRIH